MDNEHTLTYEGYSIRIVRDFNKMWYVDATKEGEADIRIAGRNRDEIVDHVQDTIDMVIAKKDNSVQVSKAGLWGWLEKR